MVEGVEMVGAEAGKGVKGMGGGGEGPTLHVIKSETK